VTSEQDRYRLGLAKVAVAATIWGSIPVLVRAVDASSFVIVFWRVFFAGLVLGGYLLLSRRLHEVFELPRRTKIALVGMGALLTLNWVLFFSAIRLTDVAVAVLLGYLGPVFVAVLSPLILRTPFDKRVLLPLALALGGTIIIVNPTQISLDGSGALLGAALAFCSAITYALLVTNAKRLVQGVPATVYMLFEYTVASLLLLPFVLTSPAPTGTQEWVSLALLGVVNTALTGFLFLSALRTIRADHAAILTYAEPVSAVVFAAVLLDEPLTATTVLGGAAVIAGGIAVARSRGGASVDGPPVLLDDETVSETPREHEDG
jgi:drug/metabolite transporter (DMT)-like permease